MNLLLYIQLQIVVQIQMVSVKIKKNLKNQKVGQQNEKKMVRRDEMYSFALPGLICESHVKRARKQKAGNKGKLLPISSHCFNAFSKVDI